MYPLLIVLAVVALFLLALLWWGTSTFGGLASIPGPQPLPLLGNLVFVFRTPQNQVHGILREQYGGAVRFFLGRRPMVLLTDPDIVHEVTVKLHEKFPNRPKQLLDLRDNKGLLRARDDYWRRLRRTISPTFNVTHLKHMLIPMHEEVNVFLNLLEDACDNKQEIDIHAMFAKLTLDIIGRIAFGTKLYAQHNRENDLIKASSVIIRNIPRNNGALAMVFPTLWVFKERIWPSQYRKNLLNAQAKFDEMSLSLIRKRIAERNSNSVQETGRVPADFLDLLLDARDKETGKPLTEEEIRDQVNTFLIAGHETTANALSYTTYLLAQHPDVDEQLFEELKEKCPDGELDLNQISSLDRLTCVLKESLRMYPPAAATARQASEDVVIGGKYFIPKGTSIIISIREINNSPDLWEQPEKFLPFERWPENGSSCDTIQDLSFSNRDDGGKKHALVWLPFGAGPRVCIGQRFAIVEAQLILAHLLRKFRIQLSPGQGALELVTGITTSPKNGIKVTLHRR